MHLARRARRARRAGRPWPTTLSPDPQVELVRVGPGQAVRLPGRHTPPSCPIGGARAKRRGRPDGRRWPGMPVPRYTRRPVKSTVETLEERANMVKLSVEVDEAEFDSDIDAAFRKIAREVRIPGFRPGKAPRRDPRGPHRPGPGPRAGAAATPSPSYLAKAVRGARRRHHRPARGRHHRRRGGRARRLRRHRRGAAPRSSCPATRGLRVELPDRRPCPTRTSTSRVDAELPPPRRADRRRPAGGQRATSSPSTSPPTRDGEPVPGLNAEDWLYEVGRGWIAEDFDELPHRRLGRRRARVHRHADAAPRSRPTSPSR